jgi:GntR family transcriptional regulator
MNTVLPVYYQIKHVIKNWIINKEFNPGERLPSENELAERFKVSRLTVRQATSQLIQEGFLICKRGKGTFVNENDSLFNSMSLETSGFMDDQFFNQMAKIQTKSVTVSKIVPPRLIKEKLKLGNEEKEVVEIRRVRVLNERLFTYSINYLPLEIGLKIDQKDLYNQLLLRILEKDLGVQFTEAVQTIEATFADQEVAEKLEIALGSPILFAERIMYASKHKPVELFQSSYRGDLYKFIVRFKKVKRKDGIEWIHRLD